MEDKVNVEGHGDDEDNDDVRTNEIGLGVDEKEDGDEYTMSVVVEPPLVVVGVGAIGSTIIFLVVVEVLPPEGE